MNVPRPRAKAKAAPKNRLAAISPARKAAFDILLAVERGHAHSDELLRCHAVESLSHPDHHLATALVLGVLRWQIRLDHQIQGLLQRRNAKLDPEVRIALRLGAFQILFMDRIPDRAAIDESVELAKQAGHRFASAMVNAVLRKLGAGARVEFPETYATELALAKAHPQWMVERWAGFYGMDVARKLCHHGQTLPAHVLRMADSDATEELRKSGVEIEAAQILSATRRVVAGDVAGSAALKEGRVRLQDEGSQLIAEIAAFAMGQRATRVLDACAAPGGKTLILAERLPDALVVACETSPSRFEQLRLRLAPLGAQIECRLADVVNLEESDVFDLALVDAPCSGTGTLGRNPEIRHRLKLDDLERQAERQRAILAAALRGVRPGGRIVYSTCSLEPEENEQVIVDVLAGHAGIREVSLAETVDSLIGARIVMPTAEASLKRSFTPTGAIRLLPGSFDCDGFFIAMLERIG